MFWLFGFGSSVIVVCRNGFLRQSSRQVESLPEEDAKYHLQRCEDSGLWVPSSEVRVGGDVGGDGDVAFFFFRGVERGQWAKGGIEDTFNIG